MGEAFLNIFADLAYFQHQFGFVMDVG